MIFDAAVWIKSCMNNLWGIEFNPINWIYQEELLFLDQVIDYEVIDYEILIEFIGFMIYFNMKIEIYKHICIYLSTIGWAISKIVIYNTMQLCN